MGVDFTVVGHALSAPARSRMVNLLMDGSTRPAGELASAAGVSPATASEHLTVLLDAGVVIVATEGRRRMYRLADAGIAGALEHLGQLCPAEEAVTYYQSRDARALAAARLCYDHLAGRLGVAVTDAMVTGSWLDPDLVVTPLGRDRLGAVGIDWTPLDAGRRRISRSCRDWTERRPHLSGALGAALATLFLDRGWVLRAAGTRGLKVTPTGRTALRERLAIDPQSLKA